MPAPEVEHIEARVRPERRRRTCTFIKPPHICTPSRAQLSVYTLPQRNWRSHSLPTTGAYSEEARVAKHFTDIARHYCIWDPTKGFQGEGQLCKHLALVSANITSWGSGIRALNNKEFGPFSLLAIQEHKLNTNFKIDQAKRDLEPLGLQGFFRLACTTSEGYPSGGVGLIWPKGFAVTTFSHPTKTNFEHISISIQMQHIGQVEVTSIYGHCGDLAGTTKCVDNIIRKHLSLAQSYVIMGDFNQSVDDMRGNLDISPEPIFRHHGPTCWAGTYPSTIDYAIMSDNISAVLSHMDTLDTALATHSPIQLVFEHKFDQVQILPRQPRPCSRVQQPVWQCGDEWGSIEQRIVNMSTQCSTHIGGSISNDLLISQIDTAWTKWVTCANKEIRPNCGVDTKGVLGGPFPIKTVSFAELAHVKGGFKHGKVLAAVWTYRRMCEMVARLKIIHDPTTINRHPFCLPLRQWTRLQAKLNNFSEEGSMPWSTSILQDIKSTWEAPDVKHIPLFEAWAAILKQSAILLADTFKKQNRSEWKDRVEAEASKGTSWAFRHIRPPAPYANGCVRVGDKSVYCPKAVLQEQVDIWSKWWVATSAPTPSTIVIPKNIDLPKDISVQQIRTAARSFKESTSSIDLMHPRHINGLSDRALGCLVGFIRLFESTATWPKQEQCVITTLIPKTDGGLRPIALFRTVYRVYSKIRVLEVKQWAMSQQGYQFNNAQGRWVGDSTWRNQVKAALQEQNCTMLEMLLDVKKAFEHVLRSQLIGMAKLTNYPMAQLISSLLAYEWARRINYDGLISDPIWPTRGIAAGSAFATFELWCLLRPAIHAMQDRHPEVTICLHVDDLCMTIMSNSRDHAITKLDDILACAHQLFTKDRGLPFAEDKAFLIGNDQELTTKLSKILCIKATPGTTVRRLGVDYQLHSKAKLPSKQQGRLPVHKARLKNGALRSNRLKKFARNGSSRLYIGGVMPATLYGVEHFQPAFVDVLKMRKQAAACGPIRPMGVPAAIRLMAYDATHDPLFTVISAPLVRWAREIWLLSSHHSTPDDVLDGLTMHKAAQAIAGTKVDELPQGPLRAMASALNVLGWNLEQAHIIKTNGQTIDLTCHSPAMLKFYIKRAYDCVREKEATDKIVSRGNWPHDSPPAWSTIRRFLRSTKVGKDHKEAILQLMYGTTPHSHWLWSHGWQISPTCNLCKKHIDNTHLLGGCSEMPPQNTDLRNWSDRLIQRKIPPKLATKPGYQCYIDGKPVAWELFHFDMNMPIYTDGSAKHVQLPEIAVCAAAAWQVDSQGFFRVVVFQVPQGAPQSAIMAEFRALSIAVKALVAGEGKAHIVSDCQSVITAATSRFKIDHPNSKFAGELRVSGLELVGKISKVAAHQTRAQANALGQGDWWFGNDQADWWAKNTLDSTGEEGLAYIIWNKATLGHLAKLAEHICAWVLPRPDPELPKVPRVPKAIRHRLTDGPPHHFVWFKQKWTCTLCGCSKSKSKSKLDGRSCMATQRITSQAHASHALQIGWLKGNLPIVFCAKCSCYTTSNSVGLKLVCHPMGKGKKTIHSRLCSGKHPTSREPFAGTIRLPNSRLSLSTLADPPADLAIGLHLRGGEGDRDCAWREGLPPEELPPEGLELDGNWPDEACGSPSEWDQEAADFLFS